jgi:hypothetical protein
VIAVIGRSGDRKGILMLAVEMVDVKTMKPVRR